MNDFRYAGHRTGESWYNPAIAELLVGPQMRNTVRSIGFLARSIYQGRAPRATGRMAANVRVTTELGGANLGSEPDRFIAVVEAIETYSAAVEFGKANTAAEGYDRPSTNERVPAGAFPARYQGAHTFGGDNRRRSDSVIAWIEGQS